MNEGSPPPGGKPARGNPMRGIIRLARFRADGLDAFTATPQAFLTSLVPLLALPLASFVLLLLRGHGLDGLAMLLLILVALLAPPVVAHVLARAWRREALWLRYAVASNWCQWVLVPVFLAATVVGGMLISAGMPPRAVAQLALLAVAGYWIALSWFLARTALQLSGRQAAGFVFLVWLALMVLINGPVVVAALLTGAPLLPP